MYCKRFICPSETSHKGIPSIIRNSTETIIGKNVIADNHALVGFIFNSPSLSHQIFYVSIGI